MTRQAISPRLAIRILLNIRRLSSSAPAARLAPTRVAPQCAGSAGHLKKGSFMIAATLALPFVTFSLSCACSLGQSLVPLVLRRIEGLGEQGHSCHPSDRSDERCDLECVTIAFRSARCAATNSPRLGRVTSGRCRTASPGSARSGPRRAPGRARGACRPGRSRRRPRGARWRSRDGPGARTARRIGALKARSSSADQLPPRASMPSRLTVASTDAACSPPITLMRAFGHIQRKRGE